MPRSPQAGPEDVAPDYRIGQVWKDRRAKPRSVFLVVGLKTRPDGALRVEGVLVAGGSESAFLDRSREMDARSVAKMYPHVMFDPPRPPEEDK